MSQAETAPSFKGAHVFSLSFLCSLIALLLSFLAILAILSQHIAFSFSIVLLAVLFDMLDGAVSRRLRQESTFGALFDLLQDLLNYLLYPSLLFFVQGFQHWLAVITLCLFVGCGVFRLARFGTIGFSSIRGAPAYMGMPVYFNHVAVFAFLLLQQSGYHLLFAYIWLPIHSLLMVSTIHFPKPRNLFLWGFVLLAFSILFPLFYA